MIFIAKNLKESFTECKGVFMVNSKLHLICGNCGCNNMWEYEIDIGGKDIDGSLFPEVFINCKNCGTIHTLDEAGAIDKDIQA